MGGRRIAEEGRGLHYGQDVLRGVDTGVRSRYLSSPSATNVCGLCLSYLSSLRSLLRSHFGVFLSSSVCVLQAGHDCSPASWSDGATVVNTTRC